MLNSFRLFVLLLLGAFLYAAYSPGEQHLRRVLRTFADGDAPVVVQHAGHRHRKAAAESRSGQPVNELTVLSPTAEAVFFVGATVEFRWGAPAFMDIESFQLDLFTAANRSRPLLRIASALPSSRERLVWTVPRNVPELEWAKSYFVRLLAFPGNSSRPRYALSDVFAIGGLAVEAPTKDLVAGSVVRVDVVAAGWGALLPMSVELVDMRIGPNDADDTGLRSIKIAAHQSPGKAELFWTVPFTLPPGCEYVYHVFADSEQDPRSGVPDQVVESSSARFCIKRRVPSSGFRLLSPAPTDSLVPGEETTFSFAYSGPSLSSWNLDIYCVNTTLPCFLGIPLVRDIPMTRNTYQLLIPSDLEPETFHWFRMWAFPVGHSGPEGEPVAATSSLLWTLQPGFWAHIVPTSVQQPVFKNPAISILEPLGEERWTKSLEARISWSISNTILESYNIELHCFDLHPNTLVATIAKDVETTRLTTRWKVPNGLPTSSRYAIRIWGHEAQFLGSAQKDRTKEQEVVEAVGQFFAIESYREPVKRSRGNKSAGPCSLLMYGMSVVLVFSRFYLPIWQA